MLRTLLIFMIAIGLGTIAVTQFVVRPHVKGLISTRDKNLREFQSEQRVHNVTKANLQIAEADLDSTEKALTERKNGLAVANLRATEQQNRAMALEGELAKISRDLAGAKTDLAAWGGLPPVDQIKAVIAEVKNLRTTNEALREENDFLASVAKKAEEIVARMDGDPILPSGLKGKVVAVDPKFDFVVLNIGRDKGVQTRAVLLIAREGELLGKVRVARVESNRSVANIIPGWKLGEIREGDLVLY